MEKHSQTAMKARAIPDLSWLERSCLIWLYFCRSFMPHLKPDMERFKHVGYAGGVQVSSMQKWLGKNRKFTPKWFHIVNSMTWKNVKAFFPKRWVSKRAHLADDLDVKRELQPYFQFTKDLPVSLSKFMDGAHSPAKRAGLSKKRPNSYENYTGDTKRSRRSDKGKARAHPQVADAAAEFILERWNTGDPCTRRQVTCNA